MEMILTGIENKNEYYTNHYFTSIFQDNAEDTIKKWKQKEKQEEIQLPWKKLRDVRIQYYNIRDRYLRSKNEEASKPMIQELATLYLKALGYESINSVSEEVADGLNVPMDCWVKSGTAVVPDKVSQCLAKLDETSKDRFPNNFCRNEEEKIRRAIE